MKRLILLLILALPLLGCEKDDNNHGYGYDHDEELVSGMRVQYQGEARHIDEETLNKAYYDTIECTGITPFAPPLVAFVDHEINDDSEYLIQGRIYLDSGLIVVMSLEHVSEEWTILVLKHELVHYLLWDIGFSDASNMAHDSELFAECSY